MTTTSVTEPPVAILPSVLVRYTHLVAWLAAVTHDARQM